MVIHILNVGMWPNANKVSQYKHLRELGYTTLFATSFGMSCHSSFQVSHPDSIRKEEALKLYRTMPDLVKVS